MKTNNDLEKNYDEKEIYSLNFSDVQEWAEEEIGRKLTKKEYDTLLDKIIDEGVFCEIQVQIVDFINEIFKEER